MGFECSINKVPKCKKTESKFSSKDFIMVKEYQHYKYVMTHDLFYIKKVKEAEEKDEERSISFDHFTGNMYQDVFIPFTKEVHNFYSKYHEENNGSPDETIDYWCSIGRSLDNEICSVLRENKVNSIDSEGSQYILSEEIIDKLLVMAEEWLKKNGLYECIVKYGIIHKDNGQMLYVPIDGIEVVSVDEDFSKKVLFNEDSCDSIFVRKTAADSETYCMWEDFRRALLEAKSVVEDYIITYERSW